MPRDERALLSKLISQHEAIYNLSSKEYRNVESRNAAWEEVSKRFGKPGKAQLCVASPANIRPNTRYGHVGVRGLGLLPTRSR